MAKQLTQSQTELEKMETALRALRPGAEITIQGNVKVRVIGVQVKNIIRFAREIAVTMPQIQGIILKGKMANSSQAEIAMAIVPIVASELNEVVNECVLPVGSLQILEPDQAADVLATWIEMNILDEGKLKRWKDAFLPLVDRFAALLPPTQDQAESLDSEKSSKS